jgi:4-hydroxy-2-oxoheptanedioate aldolase
VKIAVNRFKAAIREPGVQLGLWLSLGSPTTAEICATAGFDWLLADGEHGPNDALTITEQHRATAQYPVSFAARAADSSAAAIGPLLDAGVQTIMVPKVEEAAQAEALVRLLRYPPSGERGVAIGSIRASRWGAIDDYMAEAAQQLCLLIQLETRAGLAQLARLAAIEGVDGIFIGPNDLAASLGHPGDSAHSEVQDAIAEAICGIRAAGKPSGILVRRAEDAARFAALGCSFIAVGSDAGILAHGARRLAADARAAAGLA